MPSGIKGGRLAKRTRDHYVDEQTDAQDRQDAARDRCLAKLAKKKEEKARREKLQAEQRRTATELKWRERELAEIKATEVAVEEKRKETLARLHYLNNSPAKTFYNTLKDASQEEPRRSERRAAMEAAKAAEWALAAHSAAESLDKARHQVEREIIKVEEKKARLNEMEDEIIAAKKRDREEKLAWKAATKKPRR
eukprot:COSAG06_NODE_23675_length_684_cov_1.639316_1_plen_195_part_00